MKKIAADINYIILFISVIVFSSCENSTTKKPGGYEMPDYLKKFRSKNQTMVKASDSLCWDYEYNDQGMISQLTNPGGKTTDFYYKFHPFGEQLKQITKRTSDGNVIYSFNDSGQLIEMQDEAGTINYEYDKKERFKKVKRNNLPSVSYTYNISDQVTSISFSSGQKIEYKYDFLNRLEKMRTAAGDINYHYQTGQGFIERELPNGIKTQYQFRPDGKLESIRHIDKNNHVITQYSYTYNFEGLISTVKEWNPAGKSELHYEYDEVQRLISFTDKDGTKTEYNYDNFGNRTEVKMNGQVTENYVYDGMGRMLTASGNLCAYDDAGNQGTTGMDDIEISYNSNNQVEKLTNTHYQYDGNGSLVARKTPNSYSSFLNNPLSDIWQPFIKISDGKETFYIWEGNTPIAAISDGEVSYFLADHLSSVREIVNNVGTITKKINYTPFGVPEQNLKDFIPGFTGLFYEPEANMYLTQARIYNPQTGRFLQMDPLHQTPAGTQKDLSLYAYCGGDPVNFIDLKGTQTDSLSLLYNPFELMGKMDQLSKNLIDFYTLKNKINKGQIYANNQQSHDLFSSAQKDLIEYINPINNIYNDNKYDFAVNSLGRMFRDLGVTENMFPWKVPSSAFNAAYTVSNIIKEIPRLNQSSPGEKIDWLGNFASFANPLSTASLAPIVAKGYTGFILNALNYNPADRLMNTYGNTNISYDPITNKTTRTSNLNYREITENGYKRIIPESNYINQVGNPETSFAEFAAGLRPSIPTNVGGVYLGGAGKTFEGLGKLAGIAIDEATGKIVLLSEEQGVVDLPPLRMDDIVTIFRSVYEYGEAPFVSIDPDSLNPRGDSLSTRHGEATINTYVGWVLFETDRIMKTYSLGKDNVTKEVIRSSIPGYDKIVAGLSEDDLEKDEENWERFWIVPDEKKIIASGKKTLSLIDVSLKVKTEKMILVDGKLETVPSGKSTKWAEIFSDWFTQNYDKIAEEAYSRPPEGSGMTEPVPVFKELQRIAFITALAEQLRDQDISMPFWMRNYEVKPFVTPKKTPSITVTKGNVRIFGGVDLSKPEKITRITSSPVADKLESKVLDEIKNKPLLEKTSLTEGGKKYEAIPIPGSNTKDVGANKIAKTDMSIPISGDFALKLTRKYNSFMKIPDGEFGKHWTMDLPRLKEEKIPVATIGDSVYYKTRYRLTSPLNTYDEIVDSVQIVNDPRIGYETKVVTRPDGTRFYFDENGYLVGDENIPNLVVNKWDESYNLEQKIAFVGQEQKGDIKIKYDNDRIANLTGSNNKKVNYDYTYEGELLQAIFQDNRLLGRLSGSYDRIGYAYNDNFLTEVRHNDEKVNEFEYNERGQLLGENSPGNMEIKYNIQSSEKNHQITTIIKQEIKTKPDTKKKSFLERMQLKNLMAEKEEQPAEFLETRGTMIYDNGFRPLKQILPDGQITEWDYTGNVFDVMQVSQPGGYEYEVKQSKDRKKLIYALPDIAEIEENYNTKGQMTSLKMNDDTLFKQNWLGSLLQNTEHENYCVRHEYNEIGTNTRTLVTPPGNDTTWNRFIEYKYNNTGNIVSMNDYSGMETRYLYNGEGEVKSLISNLGKIEISRNEGLINKIQTSWGNQVNYFYNNDGLIREIKNIIGDGNSRIKFKDGLISTIYKNNKIQYSIDYNADNESNLIERIKTPVNNFEYTYDDYNRLKYVICNNRYQVKYIYDDNQRLRKIRIYSL